MLIGDVERYVALRRSLGFQLRKPARHLQAFARVAVEKGETHIRAATVIEWAAAGPTPDARNRRIGDVARFARFLRAEDDKHNMPPTGLFA
jgi:integrase/recombinase XerD